MKINEMQLEAIDPQDFGLEIQKAESILTSFKEREVEVHLLSNSYVSLTNQSVTNEDGSINYELIELAKEFNKQLIDVEKALNKTHKAEKDYYLQAGRFVDANKNRLAVRLTEMKANAKNIIDFEKTQEALIKNNRTANRMVMLAPYYEATPKQIEDLDDSVFTDFYNARKADFEKTEKERVESENYNKIVASIYTMDLEELSAYKSDNEKIQKLATDRLEELNNKEYNEQLRLASTFSENYVIPEKYKSNDAILKAYNSRLEQLQLNKYNEELQAINKCDKDYVIKFSGNSEMLNKLQIALNERILTLDEIRVSDLKSNINAVYTNVLNDINNGKDVDFDRIEMDAQEFTEIWNDSVSKLKRLYAKKQEEILSLFEMIEEKHFNPETNKVSTSDGVISYTKNDLTLDKVNEINKAQKEINRLKVAQLGKQSQLDAWIETFKIEDAPFQDEKTKLIIDQFDKFVEWASKQKV